MYSNRMLAEVLTLYLRGARMGEPRLRERGVVGDLISHRLRHRTVLTLEAKPVILKLYEPRFGMVDIFGIYLNGYEIVEDVNYRQCWWIRTPLLG